MIGLFLRAERDVQSARTRRPCAHPIFYREEISPAPENPSICYSILHHTPPKNRQQVRLTRLGGNLGSGTLSTLLALDARLALGGAGSVLGLVGLLLALSSGLLLLGVLDGGLASGGTGLGALASSLLDHVKGSTDDSTLALDDTAGTLLSDFL